MAQFYADGQLADKDYYKQPKYPIAIEALKVFLMLFMITVVIMYACYDLGKGYGYMWFSIGFLLMPLISTFVRRSIGSVFVYILVHAVMGAWLLLSPHLVLTVLGVGYWIVLSVYGVVRQASKESERELSMATLLLVIAVMIALYILAVDRNRLDVTLPLMCTAILYGVMFLYYQHWIGVHDALHSIDKEGNFSVKRIIGFNNKMFLAYLAIVVVLFAAMYFAGLDDTINWLTAMMIQFIRKAISVIDSADGSEGYVEQEAAQSNGEAGSPLAGMGVPETSPFWLVLEFILEVVFFVLVIGLIAYACYYFYKKFTDVRKYQEKDYEETKVFYKSVPKEKKPRRRSLKEIFDNSPENKIRRAYYKKVRGQMGRRVQPYETPTEVAETLTDVRELVQAYDEARYGAKKER